MTSFDVAYKEAFAHVHVSSGVLPTSGSELQHSIIKIMQCSAYTLLLHAQASFAVPHRAMPRCIANANAATSLCGLKQIRLDTSYAKVSARSHHSIYGTCFIAGIAARSAEGRKNMMGHAPQRSCPWHAPPAACRSL